MMENKFTPRAEESLRLAQEAAEEMGHGYVGSEHLLLLFFSTVFFHTNVYLFAFDSILVPSTYCSSRPLCNTTTATRTGNFSLVSNPH